MCRSGRTPSWFSDSQQEADDCLEYYSVTYQDGKSVNALVETTAQESNGLSRELLEQIRNCFAAGAGGFPLFGTADQIAAKLQMLSDTGLDGVLLTWADYFDGIERFNRQVLPLLEQSRLRQPFASAQVPANS